MFVVQIRITRRLKLIWESCKSPAKEAPWTIQDCNPELCLGQNNIVCNLLIAGTYNRANPKLRALVHFVTDLAGMLIVQSK